MGSHAGEQTHGTFHKQSSETGATTNGQPSTTGAFGGDQPNASQGDFGPKGGPVGNSPIKQISSKQSYLDQQPAIIEDEAGEMQNDDQPEESLMGLIA